MYYQCIWPIIMYATYMQVYQLDLSTVVSSMSGPKRPHDRVPVTDMKEDFQKCLDNKVSA